MGFNLIYYVLPLNAFKIYDAQTPVPCAELKVRTVHRCGSGSSVGIATDNGLDGLGSNAGGDEIFRPSRPTLGPTQPPVK